MVIVDNIISFYLYTGQNSALLHLVVIQKKSIYASLIGILIVYNIIVETFLKVLKVFNYFLN